MLVQCRLHWACHRRFKGAVLHMPRRYIQELFRDGQLHRLPAQLELVGGERQRHGLRVRRVVQRAEGWAVYSEEFYTEC